ncbi:protein BIG GRAIN 1-like E [Impatiens glandulifera]|uniref:protein BIG GRAIN 1-like E n=1 Tax=Impatiens glandulifera TaxID=253017 RepID=UPI001FB0FEE8|nr:protein BIG GRAIN 1-like E [Impatiens glandulifera]
MNMKPFHRRNDVGGAGENLDVFDLSSSSLMRRGWISGGPRMSLDMPNMRNSILLRENKQSLMASSVINNNNNNNKEKKHKQPSSPGGRLASFLNSLFSQSSSSKKKKSMKSAATQQSNKDDDESPGGGRRKRRSSISHFRGSATTPIKTMSLPSKIVKPSSSSVKSEVMATDYSWLDDKFQWDRKQRVYANGYFEKDHKKNIINQCKEEDEKEFRRFHDHDDGGGESDSSSDLFELKNYDLGYDDSCGLPVYETTHMNNIKRPPMVGSST